MSAPPPLPSKPPVIPAKPPVIPQKPKTDELPPKPPTKKPVRAASSGSLNRVSKVPPIPTNNVESPAALPSPQSPSSRSPSSPKSPSSRPQKKGKSGFKRKLFSTLRGNSANSKETPQADPPSPVPSPIRKPATSKNSDPSLYTSTPNLPTPPAAVPPPKASNMQAMTLSVQPTTTHLRQSGPATFQLQSPKASTPSPTRAAPVPGPRVTKAPVSAPTSPQVEVAPVVEKPKAPATPEEIAARNEKRKKIVGEILSTEETYVGVLDCLLNKYQRPLFAKAEGPELPNITKAQIRAIFSNVEQLLPMNQLLLSDIKERVASWTPTQLIGDIFEKTGPFFKIYNMYGNNYDHGQTVLDKCNLDPQFTAVIEQLEAEAKNLRLPNLLIQPVQRIPRYNLLLRDLLVKTEDDHPDYKHLNAALTTLEGVMNYLDKNITQLENMDVMAQFANLGGAQNLVVAHRKLQQQFVLNIREQDKSSQVGTLRKKFKTKGLFKDTKLTIWLFNDVLVHLQSTKSKKKTNVASTKHTWPLELVWVKDIPEIEPTDTKFPYSFLLVGPRTTFTLRFPDPQDKGKWMNVFSEAIATCLTEENCPDEKKLCRYGEYEFPEKDRGTYKGWWKFGKIHGQGVYTFYGNRYTGMYEYNQKSGTGTMELCSGETYQGEWKEDYPHGFGTLLYPNNDRYEGQWSEGLRSGKGTHFYANGDKYSGDWSNNIPHGEGHYTTISGQMYKGGWRNAVFHGSGLLVLPNGKIYEGEFREGYRHGEGRMDYGNGRFYVGQWSHDRCHGKGVLYCDVEGSYDGEFREDFKEGFGTMQYSNGDVYVGNWKKNLYHGNGTLTCASGGMLSYEGQWENNLKHGKGVLMYRNESRYEGHFRDDLPHGHGVYTSRAAVNFDGKWEEGRKHGKLSISVGQSKITAQCNNALMDEGKIHSFFVFPEAPVVHLNL